MRDALRQARNQALAAIEEDDSDKLGKALDKMSPSEIESFSEDAMDLAIKTYRYLKTRPDLQTRKGAEE